MSVYANGPFLHLLSDLSRNPDLRNRFIQDPAAVLDQHGISAATRGVLRAGDTAEIAAVIAREAHALVTQLRAQPQVMMPWAGGIVSVQSCTPDTGPVDTVISVQVTGTQFTAGAKLCFSTPSASVLAQDTEVHTDPQGNSTMTGKVKFAVASTYDVSVSNPNQDSGTLSSGFQASQPQ
jgi:hypothetical protein